MQCDCEAESLSLSLSLSEAAEKSYCKSRGPQKSSRQASTGLSLIFQVALIKIEIALSNFDVSDSQARKYLLER